MSPRIDHDLEDLRQLGIVEPVEAPELAEVLCRRSCARLHSGLCTPESKQPMTTTLATLAENAPAPLVAAGLTTVLAGVGPEERSLLYALISAVLAAALDYFRRKLTPK